MRKSIRSLAAALAAITAMSCTSATAFADKLKTVDGIKYRYSDSGEQIGTFSGWSTGKSGAKYYYKNGVRVKNTWIKDKKGRYRYIDKTGKMAVGWCEVSRGDGRFSWFDENGYWDGNSYCSKYSDAVRFGDNVKIKVSRNETVSEPFSGNYSSDGLVSKKKAAAYINNTEYELEVPLAVAEQLRTGDKLVFKAGVARGEKVNGAYTYKLTIPHTSGLTASKIDSSASHEQKVREAILKRFDLFNSLLVLRNGRLKLDMMYDAYRLDTQVLFDDDEYFYLYDDAKMYVVDHEKNEITYGLFGGYNKLNEKTGKFAFRDNITEKTLLKLMKNRIAEHKADLEKSKNDDVDWYVWVGNVQSCWLDVTVTEIPTLPAAAAPTADMYEEYQTDIVVADDDEYTGSDTMNNIPELYSDYIVLSGGVYYANIENEPSWKGTKFTRTELSPGNIKIKESEREPVDRWSISASVLPAGTKLWWSKEYPNTVILAEHDGRLIPYLKIVEG
ncbi:MAG: hypothetical protein IK093_02880 [Ruminiclostridium sp.]|nr:hypothetical protein [Ruminiclostridium sp.]